MDRITKVWFKNLRTLADVTLDLDGLTVLVGENGTGKSTILEGLAVLRRCVDRELVNKLMQVHGGAPALFLQGARSLTLGARVESGDEDLASLEYEVTFGELPLYGSIVIEREVVRQVGRGATPTKPVLERDGAQWRIGSTRPMESVELPTLRPTDPALYSLGHQPKDSPVLRVARALEEIRVHASFDVGSLWAANESGSPAPLRTSARLQPFDGIGVRGSGLANAYFELKNQRGPAHWSETVEILQLGLGDDIEDVTIRTDPAGGAIALGLKYRQHAQPIEAASLSDGTLAWMAFVAVHRTHVRDALIAFDEPELHLHPGLVARAVDLFESMSRSGPVVLATHSDHALDALQDPAKSVVVCELDRERRTQLRRPEAGALSDWMKSYSGYGAIRTAGHEESILRERTP